MNQWTQVVTHPLGLAGFGLFLVFMILARKKWRAQRRWLLPVFVVMAFAALVGGIGLAYFERTSQNTVQQPPPSQPQPQSTNAPSGEQVKKSSEPPPSIRQDTKGAGSPAVAGTGGNVTIEVNQGTQATQKKPEPTKKPEVPKK